MPRWIRWLSELGRDDYTLVGKKCANCGEMTRLGLPVPPGFVLTIDAYHYFFDHSGLRSRIPQVLAAYRSNLRHYATCLEASRAIREVIEARELPADMAAEVGQAYAELSARCGQEEVAVSVRSSGPVSRPGQFETYLNVRGAEELGRGIVRCWSSTFTVQALAYRLHHELPLEDEPIAVGVMRLVEARAAGVAFTADPVSGAADRIIIEGSWGLGESVVGGRVTPDRYVMAKKDLSLISSSCGDKGTKLGAARGGVEETQVAAEDRNRPCLSPEECECLAHLALKLEAHFGSPQDVEWAIDANLPFPENVFLLQTRPITGLAGWQAKSMSRGTTDHIIDLMLHRVFQTS